MSEKGPVLHVQNSPHFFQVDFKQWKQREDNVYVNFRANKLSNDKFGRTAISLVKISLRLREQLPSRYG